MYTKNLCLYTYVSQPDSNRIISGVGEGGGGGGGGALPPTLGHDCTLKFNEEKISSCSMSATVVYLEAIARLIYIYETTVKQIFVSDCTKSCLRAQNYQKFLGGMPPDPPRGVGNNY